MLGKNFLKKTIPPVSEADGERTANGQRRTGGGRGGRRTDGGCPNLPVRQTSLIFSTINVFIMQKFTVS